MKVEELKNKFKYDLIGRWISYEGTFVNIMNEMWEFFSNGTGRTISNSIMSGQDIEEFKWRRKDLYCIEIAITDPEFDEPDTWREVYYDFCLVPTDCGFLPALVEIDKSTGVKRKGFGLMEVPLSYAGDVDYNI
jgi:hypothetical protein